MCLVSSTCINRIDVIAERGIQDRGYFRARFWYSAGYSQQPATRVKRLAGEGLEITRLAEPVCLPNANRVDVHYTLFLRDTGTGAVETFSETHPMRHFSLPELEWLASATGFERLCAEEFLTGASPGPDTWGLCLVWRKC